MFIYLEFIIFIFGNYSKSNIIGIRFSEFREIFGEFLINNRIIIYCLIINGKVLLFI